MRLLESFGNEKMPSIINDPFEKTHITGITIWYQKSMFSPYEMQASGMVQFKNGQTEGKQNFNGETFDEVVLKIKAMIENL